MADHRGYWTALGKELLGYAEQGAGWARARAGRSPEGAGILLCVGAVICIAFLYSVWPTTSLAEAPESAVPGYTIISESGTGSTRMVEAVAETAGEDEFRLIAEQYRYENPDHDVIAVVFLYEGNHTFQDGIATAVADADVARDYWGDELTDSELEYRLDRERGIKVTTDGLF